MDTTRKPGDVVRLKSGGPDMTVAKVTDPTGKSGRSLTCFWFDVTALRDGEFPEETVEIIEKPGGQF